MFWNLRFRHKLTLGLVACCFVGAYVFTSSFRVDTTKLIQVVKQNLELQEELSQIKEISQGMCHCRQVANNARQQSTSNFHNFTFQIRSNSTKLYLGFQSKVVSNYSDIINSTKPYSGFESKVVANYSDIIVGITSVKRHGADYLLQTIKSLLNNREDDGVVVRFVIFIGETNLTYVQERSEKISNAFPNEFSSGVLQVVSPPASYYPDWNNSLHQSFNDPIERVKWRSKQNLDQIFLMVYVHHLSPTYYLMVEDDVIASKGYVKKILSAADARLNDDWFYISFCSLGAIGKLFRTSSLPSFVSFVKIFWDRKPLDWLQIDYLTASYCSYDETSKQCDERRNAKSPLVKPSLFQHVGKMSSLKGKIQNLQDKSFKSDS